MERTQDSLRNKKIRVFFMPGFSSSLYFIFRYLLAHFKCNTIDFLLLFNKDIDAKKFKHMMLSVSRNLNLDTIIYNFEKWVSILSTEEGEFKLNFNLNISSNVPWVLSLINALIFAQIINDKKHTLLFIPARFKRNIKKIEKNSRVKIIFIPSKYSKELSEIKKNDNLSSLITEKFNKFCAQGFLAGKDGIPLFKNRNLLDIYFIILEHGPITAQNIKNLMNKILKKDFSLPYILKCLKILLSLRLITKEGRIYSVINDKLLIELTKESALKYFIFK